MYLAFPIQALLQDVGREYEGKPVFIEVVYIISEEGRTIRTPAFCTAK